MSIKIEDCNLFMMCKSINKNALSDIPNGYHIRNCKIEKVEGWNFQLFTCFFDKNIL